MHHSIKKCAMLLFLTVALVSCNQGETLQTYYVDKQEAPNFMSVDVPVSMVKLEEQNLTDEQADAYNSIRKLNMLAYSINDNEAEYEVELQKVKNILKNDKYEDLIRGKVDGGSFVVKMISGKGNSIDELIVFGHDKERGFAIIRVLGKNMEPEKIMTLGDVINQIETDENGVQDVMKYFSL